MATPCVLCLLCLQIKVYLYQGHISRCISEWDKFLSGMRIVNLFWWTDHLVACENRRIFHLLLCATEKIFGKATGGKSVCFCRLITSRLTFTTSLPKYPYVLSLHLPISSPQFSQHLFSPKIICLRDGLPSTLVPEVFFRREETRQERERSSERTSGYHATIGVNQHHEID